MEPLGVLDRRTHPRYLFLGLQVHKECLLAFKQDLLWPIWRPQGSKAIPVGPKNKNICIYTHIYIYVNIEVYIYLYARYSYFS